MTNWNRATIFGQPNEPKARVVIPFDFVAGDTVLPAGRYEIRVPGMTTVFLRNMQTFQTATWVGFHVVLTFGAKIYRKHNCLSVGEITLAASIRTDGQRFQVDTTFLVSFLSEFNL